MDRCPGREKGLDAKIIKCPACGYLIEFFSDELKRKCPNCKTEVRQDKLPSCIDWCKSARECLGDKLWKELGLEDRKKKRLKDKKVDKSKNKK
ncbi:MAG: phosphohydrolase [Candidatus Omnitrophota bacterium]|nr:phosphohydrolase [Candidatus Omnitrophota bacterium]